MTPGFQVLPLPSTHPTLLRTDNWLDTCRRGDGSGSRKARVRERKKVLSADIGQESVALVTDDGQLYAFGFGRLGMFRTAAGKKCDVAVPTRVRGGLENDRVVHVRIGRGFTAVLTATGRVWTFGKGSIGEMGTGVMVTDAMPPQLLEGHISQFKIVQLSCGGVHTIALTETG